jgi:hypothetical protein
MKTCPHPERSLFVTPGGLTCFDCTDPAYRARYPQWDHLEQERRRKSEQAKKNFRIQENANGN